MDIITDCLCFIQGDELNAETTPTQLILEDPYVHEEPRKITAEEREFKAYRALRDGRAQARHEGKRKARQAKVRALSSILQARVPCCSYPTAERGGGSQQEEVNANLVLFLPFLSTVCRCHAPMYSCLLKINPSFIWLPKLFVFALEN